MAAGKYLMRILCYRFEPWEVSPPDPLRIWESCRRMQGTFRYNPLEITVWIPYYHAQLFEIMYPYFLRDPAGDRVNNHCERH